MIFNLIPFPPLDGGWILRHILPQSLRRISSDLPVWIIILYILLLANIISYIFIPIDIIMLYIKNNIFIMNIGLVSLPFIICMLIVYLFLREELTIFFKQKQFMRTYEKGKNN